MFENISWGPPFYESLKSYVAAVYTQILPFMGMGNRLYTLPVAFKEEYFRSVCIFKFNHDIFSRVPQQVTQFKFVYADNFGLS